MSQQQSDVVVPNADIGLPLNSSSSIGVVHQENGTQWIFYYGFNDVISYEKKPKNGNSTRHELIINGKAVTGSSTEIAAALWEDSPRVYYIDSNLVLREAVLQGTSSRNHVLHEALLQGTSGDEWINGSLSNYNWKTTVNSSLAALGTRELSGEPDIFLEVFFNEPSSPYRFTQASNNGVDKWEKGPF